MLVFVIMVNVVVIYCVYVVVNLLIKRGMLLVYYYMVVFLEILLLGYDWLVEILFGLMYCVFIGF